MLTDVKICAASLSCVIAIGEDRSAGHIRTIVGVECNRTTIQRARIAENVECFTPGIDAAKSDAMAESAGHQGSAVVAAGVSVGSSVLDGIEVWIEPRKSSLIDNEVSSEAIEVLIVDR